MARSTSPYEKGIKSSNWLSLGASLLVTLSLFAPASAHVYAAGTVTKCGYDSFCAGGPNGPRLRLSLAGTVAHVSGKDWPASKQVSINFWQRLGLLGSKTPHRAALTGLVVMANNQGNFRISLPHEGACSYAPLLTVRSGKYSLKLPRPSSLVCMESRTPNPPIETFHVQRRALCSGDLCPKLCEATVQLTAGARMAGWPET